MYLVIVNENNRIRFIAKEIIEDKTCIICINDEEELRTDTDGIHIEEVESVPAEVVPEKYCYTEADGFYLNPDWVDPEENKTEGEN